MLDSRCQIVATPQEADWSELASAVRAGLAGSPKSLPCRFLYDDVGSRLFDRICEQPEYYLTRAEREILARRAIELVARLPAPVDLVELGSGNAHKTRLIISALLCNQEDLLYVPIDVSRSSLQQSTLGLLRDFSGLRIQAIAGDYRFGLSCLARPRARSRLLLWLGSNIGNLDRAEAAAFLADIRETCAPDDALLVGVDRRKDRSILLRAYDDAAGVTAAFNRNILSRINRELGGRFALDSFRHHASWDEDRGAVDLGLVSTRDQRVALEALGLEVSFQEGEAIHTESSYKYSDAEIAALAATAGLHLCDSWQDRTGRFALLLLTPAAS